MQAKKRYTVSVEPRGKFWQARVYFEGEGGGSRRFATGIAIGDDRRVSKREATGVAEKRAAELAHEAHLVAATVSNVSLDAVADRLLKSKTADGRRPRAVDFLGYVLDKHVLPYFGPTRDVRTVRRVDLEGFKAHMRGAGFSPTGINNALTGIRQVLKFACEVEEHIEAVPLVRNVPVPKHSTAALPITPAQAAKFIRAFGKSGHEREAREFNVFLLNTALRKHEALAIRWDWIDWDAGEISIPGEYRKGGKEQKAPTQMNDTVRALLEDRLGREKQPSRGRVWFQLKTYDEHRRAAAKKAGIEGYRHHDARHTRATLLAASGATAIDLRDQIGWSTLAMVNRYTHPERDRMKEIAARVQLGDSKAKRLRPVTGNPSREHAKRRHS